MKASNDCIDLIKQFEGYRENAYQDSVGVWTLGFGSTMWNDGRRVQPGDSISVENAEKLLMWEIVNKSTPIENLNVNQNQFDALVCFAYNLGIGALLKSTLLKKVKLNPNDPTISDEFMRWVNASGKVLKGLVTRRAAEADLYFQQ
jgi:lysozyme